MYSKNHLFKTQVKQKTCENFLCILLAKKMSERSGNLKVLNCLTFNIVHIILYTRIYN